VVGGANADVPGADRPIPEAVVPQIDQDALVDGCRTHAAAARLPSVHMQTNKCGRQLGRRRRGAPRCLSVGPALMSASGPGGERQSDRECPCGDYAEAAVVGVVAADSPVDAYAQVGHRRLSDRFSDSSTPGARSRPSRGSGAPGEAAADCQDAAITRGLGDRHKPGLTSIATPGEVRAE
jgi:hypothetical protein